MGVNHGRFNILVSQKCLYFTDVYAVHEEMRGETVTQCVNGRLLRNTRFPCALSLQEAAETLQLANKHGLVHLSIYNPEQHLFALCSCCKCCCHDIEFMKKLGRPDLVAHADYVAVVDTDSCVQCGACVERCVFGAQNWESGAVMFHQDKCYGCGLCISTCESNAIRMVLKAGQ